MSHRERILLVTVLAAFVIGAIVKHVRDQPQPVTPAAEQSDRSD